MPVDTSTFGGALQQGALNAAGAMPGMIANDVLSAGMGLLLEKHNDQRQINQQQKLTNMQLSANQQMSDYNFNNQYQMWLKTNYPAQVEQMEKAGLNPALAYGMGGGGGTTTGSPSGGISGAAAPSGGHEIMDIAQQGLQNQLLQAQVQNINADTEKKKAEVPNVNASTQNILQDTDNKKAQEIGQKISNDIQTIDLQIKGKTEDAAIYIIRNQADQALQQLNILRNEGIISENTWSAKIDLVNAELAGKLISNQLQQAQTDKTRQDILQVVQDMQVQMKQLQNQGRALDQKDQDILIDQMRNKLIDKGIMWGAGAAVLGHVVDFIKPRPGGNTYNTNNYIPQQ